jgi:alkylhydroperoxidase family enzyme
MSTTTTTPTAARSPRIAPGGVAEIGRINTVIARAIRRTQGTVGLPGLFTTLARHRRLYWSWLPFAGALMPRGKLPRADSELAILRVARNCGSDYEWAHHERIGPTTGLTETQVQAVREDDPTEAVGAGFTERQALLLRAADELHEHRELSDEVWDALRPLLSDAQMIELCMLVGHYEMLAMTLNSLRVEPDGFSDAGPSRLSRILSGGSGR